MQRTDAWHRCKEETHFIYALIDPRDDRVRYIGSTVDPASRLQGHLSNPHGEMFEWILSLRIEGLRPKLITLTEAAGYFEASEVEAKYISEYEQHYGPLLNLRHTEAYGRKTRLETMGSNWWRGIREARMQELKKSKLLFKKTRRTIAESLRLRRATA
ncbi:MAG: GIY-YIG nuclease family protein [Patescibacteria group bacterium]|nr:GIY-YIG nuclease family protein [Patescibacteria group bacterium]